jgi:hypothetical protein
MLPNRKRNYLPSVITEKASYRLVQTILNKTMWEVITLNTRMWMKGHVEIYRDESGFHSPCIRPPLRHSGILNCLVAWSQHHSTSTVLFPSCRCALRYQSRPQSCGNGKSGSERHPSTGVGGSPPDCCLLCMSAVIPIIETFFGVYL